MAVAPSRHGFGFAVLEGPHRLVDWGLVSTTKRDKTTEAQKRYEYLLDLYRPQGLVVEDCFGIHCRRGQRKRLFMAKVTEYACFMDLPVIVVPWRRVQTLVAGQPKANRSAIAAAVAKRFPETSHQVPPPRKTYMAEDPRMSMFDATALAITALAYEPARSHDPFDWYETPYLGS